jgi:hypothetical protein
MDDIWKWQPIQPSAMGTLCAGCHFRGVRTMHSPAGEQHKAWEARWARDPDWVPDGAVRFSPIPPVPADALPPETARPSPRRWPGTARYAQAHATCPGCGLVHHVDRGKSFRCYPGCGAALPVIPEPDDATGNASG